MDKFVIEGSKTLHGSVEISGSKNAALPIIAATILCSKPCSIRNVPDLADINTMLKLLENMGCQYSFENNTLHIDCSSLKSTKAEYELVRKMRASILVLGPLVTKYNKAIVSLPGGCAIGVRPVNLHIEALKAMGAKINIEQGYIHASAKKLKGTDIYLDTPTVTGTENIMMAATLSDGKTTIYNAAKEPEVVDLANFLNKCGAKITGAGSSTIEITGVENLDGCDYEVMPDRIEAGTFMCIAHATKSTLTIKNAPVYCMHAIIDKIKEAGAQVQINDNTIVISHSKFLPVNIKTFAYPGFPTDMQAQFTAMLTLASGTSIIEETIFENRFQHVAELNRMGANISISGNKAIVVGVKKLYGAPVMATDLRASASLVIAALAAENTTEILRIYHLDRGYEHLDKKLQVLGARIKRLPQ
ncbi:MAG: UDP-N-acetylglucosamine 1-carboxyvinyltransferase [Desulfurella sp.]|jgi:UDP-N-acetylglucosamine 1-carboxyvinyltransferase|uniref:UDP-N-acetylglucosamine 1-carboxyvinyltransferase n=2 Tax=Desulfurella TaxID=33001 RepID=A0A1G6PLG3_9BACT|nr:MULTISPECIES: UDP-N-acetylglucosamine 1-carboxyvinyltransferase [Desulfurella]AHF96490.1 UDP-N-acetylglucosamine 1-carboxyvinyltransferase [Desulfurella acetivorans A63]HEX13736.1 UDP-N-acetylglucosamine 1-carboxyvinyltransferase [Desulfurella acetivorans]PMP63425.1 MAG: UDP-N-acetylglucosamine 1-carboxyvinyltransferase [Desulfurella multipotens]PMP87300.1 MAG: UDP-N-acetylglucosamine 1-carboxyvinyltransferase [Desulfurella sp.]SDC80889.1 UDP-N-acetylglucosamine 1-carboxyvinyltransferase [D